MNCKICGKLINNEGDMAWLDDIIVCWACHLKAVSEAKLE